MIAVMISIHPKWVDKIVSGEKTIEVRKSRPKIEPPFKCYIYHTSGGYEWRDAWCTVVCPPSGKIYDGSQKVIGEFICDRIEEYSYREFGYEISEESFKLTLLTAEAFVKYGNQRTLYGWHISNLKIYDKPKPLSCFQTPKAKCEHISIYGLCLADSQNPPCEEIICNAHRLIRPPQSWQYIEVPDNER